MSGKLDQSLDTIVAARRKNSRPLRRSRRVGVGSKPTVAPVGGVKKPTKPAKKNDKVTVPAGNIKPESKIMVSNLVSASSCRRHLLTCQPADVSEQQIKVRLV
jgi:THO complex subunit 4